MRAEKCRPDGTEHKERKRRYMTIALRATYLGLPGLHGLFKEGIQDDRMAVEQCIAESRGRSWKTSAHNRLNGIAWHYSPKAERSGRAARDRDKPSTNTSANKPTWQGF